MSGSSLAAIVAKRARHIAPGAELPHGDPTNERRAELSKHRTRLTRAIDDLSFEQAAVNYDACLDAISEGVGKSHNISQEECEVESLWLCEILESRGKGLMPISAPPADPLSPQLVSYIPPPPKKKARTTPPAGASSTPVDHKREIVSWTKFHQINVGDMKIAQELALSTEKEALKQCAKLAKAYVTNVDNAREIVRVLIKEQPQFNIDPEKITSELVTTRTVKSDHLKFWYLKPNFKDKDVDLLLRVARHKSGLLWEISQGVHQPAHSSVKDLSAITGIAGIGTLTSAAAMSVAANAAAAAEAAANRQRELHLSSVDENNALALLAGPSGAQQHLYAAQHDGQIVKAVVVGDTGLELSSIGAGMGGDVEGDGSVGMHELSSMGGADVHDGPASIAGLGVSTHADASVDTMMHAHMSAHADAPIDAHAHADLMAQGGTHDVQPGEHEGMAQVHVAGPEHMGQEHMSISYHEQHHLQPHEQHLAAREPHLHAHEQHHLSQLQIGHLHAHEQHHLQSTEQHMHQLHAYEQQMHQLHAHEQHLSCLLYTSPSPRD